ncbi:putative adhesin [Streptomyces sp. NPDC001288]|uniref:putative adhesin n=1 Tax=unclassified Streptomyces TaxID=2593676 RepID=UPI003322B97A
MTTGIIAGHGWHDDTDFIVVPQGIRLGFYASPDSGLDFAVMEEAVRRADVTPLECFDPGARLPNYTYEQFSDLETARVVQANVHDLALTFVEGRTRLCTDTAVCTALPRHTCDGVLGRAAEQRWHTLHVFACRTNTSAPMAPTNAIRDRHGNPTTEYHDEWKEWIRSFLFLPNDAQDAAWAQMPPQTQAVLGADLEVRE